MSLYENFPYTNLHELNLDWLVNQIKNLTENMVISVNGQTGEVILYQNATVEFPAVTDNHWSIVRTADGTSRGIMFGADNKAYIVHGSLMNDIYSNNNQPPYPVTQVNGQTGDITLYTDRVVRLPSLSDEEIHSWNIFRDMNNISSGIEFDEAGDAYVIFGTQRYKLYSAHSEPPYPVTSVNDQTGDVSLFVDEDGEVAFPAFVDADYNAWVLRRDVNDHRTGLVLGTNGRLSFFVDSAMYTVYTANNPQPDWVDDPTANIIEVTAPSSNNVWGFIRETDTAPVGILFDNTTQNTPTASIRYVDSNNTVQTLRLLTTSDIPQSEVVSVNGLGGIVVLTGANINVSTTDTRKINVVLASLETAKQVNRQAMAYNETSNTATNDIPAGAYVFWNNGAYKARTNISYGDTLNTTNLALIQDSQNQNCGFTNDLNNNITHYLASVSATNTSNTITIPKKGTYLITLFGQKSSGTIGNHKIYKNGNFVNGCVTSDKENVVNLIVPIECNTGDIISFTTDVSFIYNNSGYISTLTAAYLNV